MSVGRSLYLCSDAKRRRLSEHTRASRDARSGTSRLQRLDLGSWVEHVWVLPLAWLQAALEKQPPRLSPPKEQPAQYADRKRRAQFGLSDGERVQTLGGLKPGEQVIVFGFGTLTDGDPVFPTD